LHVHIFGYFRYALENFFNEVINEIKTIGTQLNLYVSKLNKYEKLLKLTNPTMSSVNRALLDDIELWKLTRKAFKFPDIKFPNVDGELLYGFISSDIHNPNLLNLIVGDKSMNEIKDFYKCIVEVAKLKYIEYNEELAASFVGDIS
jgi:hypothetical protein